MLLKGKIPREEGFLRRQYIRNGGLDVFGVNIDVYTTGKFQNMLKLIPTAVDITGVYIYSDDLSK